MRAMFVAFVLMLGLVAPARAAWQRPVPGAVARPFTYARGAPFEAGGHRGVDLRARVGSRVGAACAGVVATAGPHVVTLRCGPWRVTALPLSSVAVRVGERLHAGAAIGRVGTMPGHVGLHVGVRRADDPFAYVDPAPLLGEPTPRPPLPTIPREGPRPPALGAHTDPTRPGAAPALDVLHSPAPGGVRVSVPGGRGGLAPWPAWVGLGLLALGAVGGGVRIGLRRRVSPLAEPAADGVPSAP